MMVLSRPMTRTVSSTAMSFWLTAMLEKIRNVNKTH